MKFIFNLLVSRWGGGEGAGENAREGSARKRAPQGAGENARHRTGGSGEAGEGGGHAGAGFAEEGVGGGVAQAEVAGKAEG